MEIDCLLPGNGSAVRFSNVNPSTLPATAPYGAWSAFWTYSGNSGGLWQDNSEIDVMEIVNSSTVDSTVFTGLERGTMTPLQFVRSTNGGNWQSNGTLNFRNVDLSLARHKFALLWTPNTVYRYLDGQMLSGDEFRWGSGDRAQVGVDLSAGSLSKSDAANLQFPYNSACFPYSFNIYSQKIWTLKSS
jgi:Glycosyl hydrolases family 16